MEQFIELLKSLTGTVFAIILIAVLYFLAQRLLKKSATASSSYKMLRRIVLFTILFVGILLVVMILPIGDELRGQIISFLGVIISAGVVLSSTTLLGNALSALMMRIVNPFQVGDFIRTNDCFGRVTNRGVFHTEVQTADRDLMTIPNLHLATNPVRVIRNSGTIISATVSLGYDVPRVKIEAALVKAAEETGLSDPFVFVTELGDFSVIYKVHGLLEDINLMLSKQSRLMKNMLDKLHEDGIEIVSPTFMNQRQISKEVFIPKRTRIKEDKDDAVEHILFDKAELAKELENSQMKLGEIEAKCQELEAQLKKEPENEDYKRRLEVYQNFRDKMTKKVQEGQDKMENE